ncbi:MAG: hypothetical protein RR578_03530 [Bacilli bacterium]|uniref:hypothetical protein n=1 Tax=Algoriella sp. TaxID=1872434 RepID=UPI002FC6391E
MGKRKQEEEVLKPEIIETKQSDIPLGFGECLIEILDGTDKGTQFKTSIVAAEKYYNDESKFKVLKKNQ